MRSMAVSKKPRRNCTWIDDLQAISDCEVELDVLLAPMTTFRIGGPAEALVSPLTPEAAAAVWRVADGHGTRLTIVGGGTNVLISDFGLPGIVLDLSKGFGFLREHSREDGSAMWEIGAGCGTGKVVRLGVTRGLLGPEVLAGVPGSMGGAIIMNAGGHEGEIELMVARVQVVVDGELRWLAREEVGFSYRSTRFPARSIVLGGEFELRPGDSAQLRAQVKASQKRRRATQPLDLPNAGSIFKNPEGDFAGRLIEAAGCKGWQEGAARVSDKHANFIVNGGGATAGDVALLAKRVRDRVLEHSGVTLQLEVKFMGRFDEEGRP